MFNGLSVRQLSHSTMTVPCHSHQREERWMALLYEAAIVSGILQELAADAVHRVVGVHRIERHLVGPDADQWPCLSARAATRRRSSTGKHTRRTELPVQPWKHKSQIAAQLVDKCPRRSRPFARSTGQWYAAQRGPLRSEDLNISL